ncbi:MAG: hypothetical protein ACYDHH_34215 [Solirubrobacteraceae bacterium]
MKTHPLAPLTNMMLIHYQGQVAGFVGATRYQLTRELQALPTDHPDRRRLDAVCLLALEYRATTGRDLGTAAAPRSPRR